jgi:hypothetical protein
VRSKTEAVVVAYREKITHPKVPHGIPSREPVDEHWR